MNEKNQNKPWTKENLNPLGRWLRLCHECDCGSEKICEYNKEKDFKYCPDCKEKKFLKYQ